MVIILILVLILDQKKPRYETVTCENLIKYLLYLSFSHILDTNPLQLRMHGFSSRLAHIYHCFHSHGCVWKPWKLIHLALHEIPIQKRQPTKSRAP